MLELRSSSLDHPDVVALIERAQQYYVELYGGPDADPILPVDVLPPRGGFWAGYDDELPVAMGGWTRSGPDEKHGAIRRMFVVPSARRSGVARRILATLEADAQASGVTQMTLTTGRPQTAAIAFYRAAGYVDIPSYGYYAAEDDAVHLGKSLPGAN